MKIANGYQPWCFDYGDSGIVDIVDVLPSDPFGMDINSTFTAITGWLEDLEVDYNQYGKDDMFVGLSFIWNNAMRFYEFSESSGLYNNKSGFDGDGSCHGAFISASSVDEVLSLDDHCTNGEVGGSSDHCTNGGGENANVHPAFGFCLYHLGVKDLLSVSMVCKSLHTIVLDDSLLWKHIHIRHPLNEKITDEALLDLTERAQGTLQYLRLKDCFRITDNCLKQVLERNPQVVKLSIPGCTSISVDGVLSILTDLKSAGKLQLKQLEIGRIFGVTKDNYDELSDLLNINNKVEQTIQKPRFYHRRDSYVSCCDDRALDIEKCPKCQEPRLVYDCPAEDCKGKEEGSEGCRGCPLCIQRCFQCGRCIDGNFFEETFSMDVLCFVCLDKLSSRDGTLSEHFVSL